MDDLTNVTLNWEEGNVIESAHRIYRSSTPFEITDLPQPVAILGSNVLSYIDTVTAGMTYYYRVSAVGYDTEEISNLSAVFARRNIHPHLLTSTNIIKLLPTNRIDLIEHSTYTQLKVNYHNIVALSSDSIDIFDVNGNMLSSLILTDITPSEVIDIELSWDNTLVLITANELIRCNISGDIIATYASEEIKGYASNIGGYIFTVIHDGNLFILDYHLNVTSHEYINKYTKSSCGMGYYAVYDNNSVIIYRDGRTVHSIGGMQVKSVNFDEHNNITIIDSQTIRKYDSNMHLLYQYISTDVINDAYMDNHGESYIIHDNTLSKILMRTNSIVTSWELPLDTIKVTLPSDEIHVPPVIAQLSYAPLVSVELDANDINTEDFISSSIAVVNSETNYSELVPLTSVEFTSIDYTLHILYQEDVEELTSVDGFNTSFEPLSEPEIEGKFYE